MREDELQQLEQRYLLEEQGTRKALPFSPQQTIHYTELPEDNSNGGNAQEWNYFRREIGRLVAEGHEGRWVLIKGKEIIGIWDTEEEANQARLQTFLMQDVLIHQVRTHEPLLRSPMSLRLWRD